MTQRIHGLDILRAGAIGMVIAAHYPKGDAGGIAVRALNFGWAGVDLFFVLSGYLIARQLLKPGAEMPLRTFYASRLLRTLPCYYVVLAAYALLASPAPAPVWKFALFGQNFGIPNVFTPSWSLCVEEHFYALFPLAVLAAGQLGARQWIPWAAGGLLVVELGLRAGLWFSVRPDLMPAPDALASYLAYFYYPTWSRLDGLASGVGLAAIEQLRPRQWRWLLDQGNRLLAASAICFAAAAAALWQRYSLACCAIGFTLIAISFGLLTAAAMSERSVFARIRVPGAGSIAALSYSLYLTHSFAIETASSSGISMQSAAGLTLTLLLLAASAAALHVGVERPFLQLRSRILSAPAPLITIPAIARES